MLDKLEEIERLYVSLEEALSNPQIVSNQAKFQKLSREHRNLEPIIQVYRELRDINQQIEANKELIEKESGELKEMAYEENEELKAKKPQLEQKLRVLLLPKDPNDDKNIMLEIRAGAGGDEAGIFANDLLKMYARYAENRGWRVEMMELSQNDVGGIKQAIVMIRGDQVYSRLKYESGVHRVQRVPKTETQGRVHTSTVTVAVLPEAEDVEINIDPKELRIDVFRSSGPGGQSVNTTDSAVRITHLPTNLVVTCQDEKSQLKNKAKAMKVLKTRLLDAEQQKVDKERSEARSSQVGTGERSEKIRTYNYPQSRVTDHRVGLTIHSLDAFVGGDIDAIVDPILAHNEAESLKSNTAESNLAAFQNLRRELE